jgi:nucleoside diphosphate kinase
MDNNSKQLISNADSLGNALDYTVQSDPVFGLLYGKRPQFDPWRAYQIIKNDPVVKGAILSIVDKLMGTSWRIESLDNRSFKKDAVKKLEELRFNKVLKNMLIQALIFKNSFLEIVKKGDDVTDINVLETSFMKINSKRNGDIVSYSQYVGDVSTENLPEWNPEEIAHFKLDEMNTNAWSDSDLMVLYDTIMIKDYARQFILWLFSSNQLRPVISVESKMNNTKAQDFLSWLKATEKDLRKPIILEGKVTINALYDFSKQGGTIQQFMDWCDSQILQLLQVPPISMGKADQSGRSNGSVQTSEMNVRIRSLQLTIEDFCTYDLFPKLGYDKLRFRFNTLDFSQLKEVIDMVQVAKNAQMSDDAITELMEKNGLTFETEELFVDPVEQAQKMSEATNKMVGAGNEGSIGNKDSDQMPSRKRQSSSEVSKANKKPQR